MVDNGQYHRPPNFVGEQEGVKAHNAVRQGKTEPGATRALFSQPILPMYLS